MGTRGAIGWILDGEVKAIYNHFDSYPDVLGRKMLDAFNAMQGDLGGWKAKAKALTFVEGEPTPDDIERLTAMGITPQTVSTGRDWYAWLRNPQGDLLEILNMGLAEDGTDFLGDSLFCEYAYLVDFDSNELVCLKGFNKKEADAWPPAQKMVTRRNTYHAVSLAGRLAPSSTYTDMGDIYFTE